MGEIPDQLPARIGAMPTGKMQEERASAIVRIVKEKTWPTIKRR